MLSAGNGGTHTDNHPTPSISRIAVTDPNSKHSFTLGLKSSSSSGPKVDSNTNATRSQAYYP